MALQILVTDQRPLSLTSRPASLSSNAFLAPPRSAFAATAGRLIASPPLRSSNAIDSSSLTTSNDRLLAAQRKRVAESFRPQPAAVAPLSIDRLLAAADLDADELAAVLSAASSPVSPRYLHFEEHDEDEDDGTTEYKRSVRPPAAATGTTNQT